MKLRLIIIALLLAVLAVSAIAAPSAPRRGPERTTPTPGIIREPVIIDVDPVTPSPRRIRPVWWRGVLILP